VYVRLQIDYVAHSLPVFSSKSLEVAIIAYATDCRAMVIPEIASCAGPVAKKYMLLYLQLDM
jgi:hypothetical protein